MDRNCPHRVTCPAHQNQPSTKDKPVNFDSLTNVLASIVVVAGITALVARGDKTAAVIGAFGKAFSGAISASLGQGVNFS